MKIIATSYKGKHFVLEDEDCVDEFDIIDDIDVGRVISNESSLRNHVVDCIYYGIPAYIGNNKELKDKIDKIEQEFFKNGGLVDNSLGKE